MNNLAPFSQTDLSGNVIELRPHPPSIPVMYLYCKIGQILITTSWGMHLRPDVDIDIYQP